MTRTSARTPWSSAAGVAALHAVRSQDELEREFAATLQVFLPGVPMALCLNEGDGRRVVRFAIGGCALEPLAQVDDGAWQLPGEQRLPVRYGEHELGELLVGAALDEARRNTLEDVLVHFATALVNLALNDEARRATDDYCVTLQALEEGIVLFQEEDPEAVTARLLALASSMVDATAGALYVLEEVGQVDSGMLLRQALGIPEQLLAAFVGIDGASWPDCLLDGAAGIARRDAHGNLAGLAAECVPDVLEEVVVLPLRYHGVQAGVCVLFNPKVDATKTHEIIGRLQSFGQLAAALLHRLHLERLRESSVSIERELQIAETIQKRLVPSKAPDCEGYEFAWHSLAAKSIGGDYVDFVQSDLGDLYAIVADASGHGINSALLMTSFRANYRGNAPWVSPAELAASLNTEVVDEVGPTGMFITAAMACIERESGSLSICSAGHNPIMIYRARTGEIEQVDSHGPPMGFMDGIDYEQYDGELESGDVVLLYTDGITEATNSQQQMFGEERLEALLQRHAQAGAQAVLDATLAELQRFSGRETHEDDVTVLVVRAK